MSINLKEQRQKLTKEHFMLYVHQRVEKGFSNYDLADFDDYLLKLLSAALYELASKKDHYPDNMFNSLEEYQEYLRNLAIDFGVIDELKRKDAHSHGAKTLLPIAFKKLEKIFWTLWI
jgi:hypothetical protein